MDAKEEMRRSVAPGQPYYRKDVAQPDEVSYVVNGDNRAGWYASWALIVRGRPAPTFEVSWYQEGFTSRDAAANSLADQFEQPMRYLRLYKDDGSAG